MIVDLAEKGEILVGIPIQAILPFGESLQLGCCNEKASGGDDGAVGDVDDRGDTFSCFTDMKFQMQVIQKALERLVVKLCVGGSKSIEGIISLEMIVGLW